MIKATELRIGNWFNYEGHPAQMDEDFFEVLFGARNYFALSPIPLSPEILEKAGFVYSDGFELCYLKNGAQLFQDETGFYHINDAFHTHIDHVHTLQNWWHSNTAEELIINL